MPGGDPQNDAELERFIKKVLDELGLTQPDNGAADKSIAKAKLATDALNAFLKTLGIDLGITIGVQALSWTTGQAVSATATVTHGLKDGAGANRTPTIVLPAQNGTGGPDITTWQAKNIGATTFDLLAEFRSGTAASNLNINFGWAAIG